MSDTFPIGHWVDQAVHDLLDHDAAAFDTVGRAIEGLAALIERSLQAVPMWMMMAFFIGIGLWRVGWRWALYRGIAARGRSIRPTAIRCARATVLQFSRRGRSTFRNCRMS